MSSRKKERVRWQYLVLLRIFLVSVCIPVVSSCEKPTDERLTDWERYAVLNTECELKLLSLGSCDKGTPAEIQQCIIKKGSAIYFESPCQDAEVVFEKLLVAENQKALTLLKKMCRGSTGLYDEICNSKSFKGYAEKWRRVGEKIKHQSEERLAKLKSFEERDPGGFLQAEWGSSIVKVANEIISNVKPKAVDYVWKEIREAAAGRPDKDRAHFSFTDQDGTWWFFTFHSDGFDSYSKSSKSKTRAADLLVSCRESFGSPTKEYTDADGNEQLIWRGPKTFISYAIDDDGKARVDVSRSFTKEPDKEQGGHEKTLSKTEQP
ncbi:MAG: hypothetical protein GY847_28440 [Proteobacteria bacterium]|nr:hypothetical protein [Pseudomonadota bacterium]